MLALGTNAFAIALVLASSTLAGAQDGAEPVDVEPVGIESAAQTESESETAIETATETATETEAQGEAPDALDPDAPGSDAELDEWGLPVEPEEPEAPPPPYDVRLGYEVVGSFVGALVIGAAGFLIGAASAGVDTLDEMDMGRAIEDVMLGGLIGTAIAFPLGSALGTWLVGDDTGGSGQPAGPIVGSLLGAGVGFGVGAAIGFATEGPEVGGIVGGISGGLLSLLGAVIGYELTSGPHPTASARSELRAAPFLAPSRDGLLVGARGTF